jgi:hypothetical protein
VASSVNGQIMPPVMGAAAFLMVEYVGIPYFDVVKHAFLPAVISYIALVYIVHLEAMKANMQGLPKPGVVKPMAAAADEHAARLHRSSAASVRRSITALAGSRGFGDGGLIVIRAAAGRLCRRCWVGSRYPELKMDDPNARSSNCRSPDRR